jgi:regulatory protein
MTSSTSSNSKSTNPNRMDSALLTKLARYCAYQERCISEIKLKIQELDGAELQDDYIQWLQENNYLNEQRFIGLFIRSKFNQKKWGRGKIQFELRKKGISDSDIQAHWDEIAEADYTEALKVLLEKKATSLKSGTPNEKYQKCYRTGLSKGFEPSLVSQVLKGLFPKGFA